MAKQSKRFRRAAEYAIARTLVFFLAFLPLGAASWVGRRLGDIIRLVDGGHRRRAEEQAAERLGLDPEAARDFAKRNFRNYGMSLAEFAHLSRMEADDFRRYVDMGDFEEKIRTLRQAGKGVVMITGHFGNWEWCNSCARTLGYSGGAIARPLDNPRLNEFVRSLRERNGLRIFDKQGAIRKALAALKNNDIVGVLIDQDAGRQGLMSPFLGRPASTITIPVELAARVGSPMLAAVLRRGGGTKRFTLLTGPEARYADPDADKETETRRLVDQLNADLEALIMQAPDQWFWIHRRWKSEGKR